MASPRKRSRDHDDASLPLAGRVFLITGAGGGIGRATSCLLARRGADVVCADINHTLAQETAELITAPDGGRSLAVEVDVSDPSSVQSMMVQIVSKFGRLDGALNAAGVEGERAPIHECSLENFDRVMNVNLRGTFLCMQAELKQFLKQPPPASPSSRQEGSHSKAKIDERNYCIVNVSSTAGQAAMPEFSSYSASKFALLGLTRTAAKEYAAKGVRVCAVCPSTTATPMVTRFTERWPEWQARQNASFPVGRIAQPEEVASAIAFLMSAECVHMTGCSLTIDGGLGA